MMAANGQDERQYVNLDRSRIMEASENKTSPKKWWEDSMAASTAAVNQDKDSFINIYLLIQPSCFGSVMLETVDIVVLVVVVVIVYLIRKSLTDAKESRKKQIHPMNNDHLSPTPLLSCASASPLSLLPSGCIASSEW